jgi:LysM repeat protein
VLSGNVPIPTVLVIGTPTVHGECSLPQGWTTYTVQPGDTLFRIALAVHSTVGELRNANCLQNVDNIIAGTNLFVPRALVRPLQPVAPVNLSTIILVFAPQGCTNAGAQITAPIPGQFVTGVFTVFGTATVENFQYYRIEVRPDTTATYNFYDRIEVPVVNNALAQINSDLFDDGLYWVRLTVVDNTGNFPEPCAIPLIFH